MNKLHSSIRNSRGFTHILTVLVVVVVVAIAAVGTVVYKHNHKPAKNLASTSQGQKQPAQPTKSTTGTTTEQPAQQYLDIKEWGVRLPLSSTISDAYYVASTSNVGADGVPNAMLLGLTSLDADGCYAAGVNTGKDTTLAAVLRVPPTEKDFVSGQLYISEYPNGTTIGSYYYAIENLSQHITCVPQSTAQSVLSAFYTAGKNIITD